MKLEFDVVERTTEFEVASEREEHPLLMKFELFGVSCCVCCAQELRILPKLPVVVAELAHICSQAEAGVRLELELDLVELGFDW